ncbi:MAG: acetate/propionate family kinase [Bryobacterales bacterium]|nr:acetate/propionate family kinase [Bryobacterales bacterium]
MNILVANLGSTSVKYQLLDMPSEAVIARGKIERVTDYRAAVEQLRKLEAPVDAVAFKAVHAGPEYCGTYVIDEGVMRAMDEFQTVAPLHNQIYLDGIRAFEQAMPGVPLVAAFETEFHARQPPYARHYGIPREWSKQFGIVRYGFHGASHEWVSVRAAELLNRPATEPRIVSCHLGGSSSICAIKGGISVDCSMGFSPQSGLENATRHGDLDPFAVFYLLKKLGLSLEDLVERLLEHGGLAGLSGIAGGDIRDIAKAADGGDSRASEAFDLFCYSVRKYIGAYAAALEGLDAIAFTGGIGENSFRLRSMVCLGLAFLGVELNEVANVSGQGDRVISTDSSRIKVLIVEANEERIVARRAMRALNRMQPSHAESA